MRRVSGKGEKVHCHLEEEEETSTVAKKKKMFVRKHNRGFQDL